jgi:ATP-binding cassette subfamily B protein
VLHIFPDTNIPTGGWDSSSVEDVRHNTVTSKTDLLMVSRAGIHQPAAITAKTLAFSLVRDHWGLLCAGLLLTATHGFGLTLQSYYLKEFLDLLSTGDQAPGKKWPSIALFAICFLVATICIRMLCWHAGFRVFTRLRERVVLELRGRLMGHINVLCLRFHSGIGSGELVTYFFGRPLTSIMAFFQHVAMGIPGALVNMITLIALFMQWDRVVASVIFVLAVGNVFIWIGVINRTKALTTDIQNEEAAINSYTADVIRGMGAIRMYSIEQQIESAFLRKARGFSERAYRCDVENHVQWMKQESFGYLCYALLMIVCAWRFFSGNLSIGAVVACFSAYATFQGPWLAIFQACSLWGAAVASLERIAALLQTRSTTPDPAGPYVAVPRRAAVRFESVDFSYDGSRLVLRDLSFGIECGQRVALVGPSGSGKTTITSLLLRLYDPTSGSVRLGNSDLRTLAGCDLRRRFGVVPQQPYLFAASLRENISLYRPLARESDILRACRHANLMELIDKLPRGLDTVVGDGGTILSGGQKQRVAIARAFLTDPDIYIFDEATSALDGPGECLIHDSAAEIFDGKTGIFIAHRMSTIESVDKILVIDEGKLVQEGTYQTLASEQGTFRQLLRGRAFNNLS